MNLKFESNGLFYNCYSNDAIIMHLLFGYKLNKGKVSFPVKYKNKIITTLERKKINYNFDDLEKKEFNVNNYNKYYNKASIMLNINIELDFIKSKLLKMNNEELDLFIKHIKRFFDER